MFFWQKKKILPDLSWIGADMHSHVIPGIDDGATDMETAMAMIRGFMELGYEKMVTTPHILWEIYPNTPEKIQTGFGMVQQAMHDAGMQVSLSAAAEYFIDDHFTAALQNKEPLLTLANNLVLVEFSMITAPMDLQESIFEMQLQGYQPVIAHPERYVYAGKKKGFFEDLKTSGCLFQVNLLSLTGYYGSGVQELAAYLIKNEYYDLAGTDMHSLKHLHALEKLSSSSLLKKLKASETIRNRALLQSKGEINTNN
jgi:tyrosine-protein phosphatase YwqE